MVAPDLEVIKDIPGYKVILKAVIKNQIQLLVEQLATTTDEESVILTASVSDGTLSQLGSTTGKGFLEDHEDIKSQFLGFCLKSYHKTKEKQNAESLQAMEANTSCHGNPGFSSPNIEGQVHPVSLIKAGPVPGYCGSVRLEPYPSARPGRRQFSSNNKKNLMAKVPISAETSNVEEQVTNVKRVIDDNNDASTTSTMDNNADNDSSLDTPGQDSNVTYSLQTSYSGDIDPNVNVKIESITEAEFESEIIGVEPGHSLLSQDNQDLNTGANYDLNMLGDAMSSPQGDNQMSGLPSGKPKAGIVNRKTALEFGMVEVYPETDVWWYRSQRDAVLLNGKQLPEQTMSRTLDVFFPKEVQRMSSARGGGKYSPLNQTILDACLRFVQTKWFILESALIKVVNDKCSHQRRPKRTGQYNKDKYLAMKKMRAEKKCTLNVLKRHYSRKSIA